MYIQILEVERLNSLDYSKAQLKQEVQLPSQYKQSKTTPVSKKKSVHHRKGTQPSA